MSEREEHFNLGSGWPLAKDEPEPPDERPFIARAKSKLRYRIAFYMAIGTTIGGLYLFWHWYVSRPEIVDARLNHPLLDLTLLHRSEAEASSIAIAEVKRREGWSGKVIEASPEGGTWYILVESEPDKRSGMREMRRMAVTSHTGKVSDYGEAYLRDLPESRR
jgi:hypothetical protein